MVVIQTYLPIDSKGALSLNLLQCERNVLDDLVNWAEELLVELVLLVRSLGVLYELLAGHFILLRNVDVVQVSVQHHDCVAENVRTLLHHVRILAEVDRELDHDAINLLGLARDAEESQKDSHGWDVVGGHVRAVKLAL